MKARVLFPIVALATVLALSNAQDAQAFEFVHRFFGHGDCGCCDVEPTCCEAEPVCCDPEPVCCEPEPTCCEADACGCPHRRPIRNLLKALLHHCRQSCCDCCEAEVSCCEPEPVCGCGH